MLLTMIDNRFGVQIAAAEGSASKTDIGGFGSLFGATGGGAGRQGRTERPQPYPAGQSHYCRIYGRLQKYVRSLRQ
jgi:hypothetical protein